MEPTDKIKVSSDNLNEKTNDRKGNKNKNTEKTKSGLSKKEERKQKYKMLNKMKEMKNKTKKDDISDQRLLAFAQNPKKFRNKLKYKKKD